MPKDFTLWEKQLFTARSSLAERPPQQYLVNPLLILPSLSLVYGISGSLKTNLMIDLAVCVATGNAWLSPLEGEKVKPHVVNPSPILWIDVDSGQHALHQRFGAMLRAHKGTIKTPIFYASFLNPSFTAVDAAAVTHIIQLIRNKSVKLVVFDNLGTISGGQEENSAAMIPVMSNLRYISEQTGAAVVVIHHDTKNDNGGRKTPRGHSSIEASLDLALLIQRDEDLLKISATKTRGSPIEPFSAFWRWESKPGEHELHWAQFFGVETEIGAAVLKARDTILKRLKTGVATQSELIDVCKEVKIPKHKCLVEVQYLAHQRKIIAVANQAHNRTLYRLPA